MNQSFSASKNKALLAESLGLNNPNLWNIVALVAFAVSLGWFTDTTLHFMQSVFDASAPKVSLPKLFVGLFPFPFLLLIVFLRWKWAQKKARDMRAKIKDVQPHEAVIMFLSSLKSESEWLERVKHSDESVFKEPYFPWMQSKRGLQVHQGHLKKVWVVCSPESAKQFKYFKAFFEGWFSGIEFVQVGGNDGVPFEDLDGLIEVIEDVFQSLPRDIDEVEVVIDITSGTKTASIAGLIASLSSEHREIQYVLEENLNDKVLHHVKTYKYDTSFLGKELKKSL